jgi:hypothetical protein
MAHPVGVGRDLITGRMFGLAKFTRGDVLFGSFRILALGGESRYAIRHWVVSH